MQQQPVLPAGYSVQRLSAILFLVISVIAMGQTMLFSVLAPLGRAAGLMEFQIGMIFSTSSLAFVIASPRWGRLSDRWGRKPVMLLGLLSYCFGALLFTWILHLSLIGFIASTAATAVALAAARTLQATVMCAAMPSAYAYMADITSPEKRMKGMSILGAGHNTGSIFGPAIGGLLTTITLLTPLWTVSVISLVAAALAFFLLPSIPPPKTVIGKQRRIGFFDRRVFPCVALGALFFIGFALIQQTVAFRIQDSLQIGPAETARLTGFALMFSALASLLAQTLAGTRRDASPWTLLAVGMPCLLAASLIMALFTTYLLIILAMVILGVGMGLVVPSFISAASLAVRPEEQGAVAGITSTCPPLGFMVGPLLGTSLYQLDGTLPYFMAAGLSLFLIALSIRLRLRPPRRTSHNA